MDFASRKVGEERLDAFFSVLQDELLARQVSDDPANLRQIARMRKRACYHRPSLDVEAIEKFVAINAEVKSFKLDLDDDVTSNAKHFITVVLERFTARISPDSIQETLEPSYLLDNWRYGPGASYRTEGTHTVEKILQAMTVTSSCAPLIYNLRRFNPYFASFDRSNGVPGITEVGGSRLTTVPKNEDTVRTIAIEPSGNMVLQLAAGRYLEGALKMIGLDITNQQPKNKLLARRGSMDGSIATIDLASASDRISIDLVRALMPPKWVHLLMTLRSPKMDLPKEGGVLELAMISTMGNGFTFPLMTLLLVSLIYGLRCRRKNSPTLFLDWSNTCVFGDDIIVPKDEYADLCEVLRQAGFVVNNDKSYSEGPFRESCGGDYHCGRDITPFYVKSLRCDTEVYVAINQVLEWCAREGCILYKTLLLLRSYVDKVRLVPEWHGPQEGVLTALCPRRYTYLRQVNRKVKVREDHPFLVMLACGGYVDAGDNLDIFYSPRPFKNEVRVKASRLPNGYLDGADPVKRSATTSEFISNYVFILNT